MLYHPQPMLDTAQSILSAAADRASEATGIQIRLVQTHVFADGRQAGRFMLPNGLNLIVLADDRASVFAYQTWFKVGSKDEDPQRTGLAHLFEHLMFKGTPRFATGTFDREMERRGAQTNAATWVDWTYYTEALAARGDNLETVIAFEADRMVNLQLDAQTFRSELEVVKNERRMAVDDALSGTLSEQLMALAFRTHPYRWPTIGSMEHLQQVTMADLERFYRAYYAPNNATVVLVGALDVDATLQQLVRAYGTLAAQTVQQGAIPVEVRQTESRMATLYRPMLAPQLVMGFHAPGQNTGEFIALEMLCDTLVAGDTSRLYERLVLVEKMATEVSGMLLPFADPGLLELHVMAHPLADPHHIVRVVQEELDRLTQGVSPAEREKACNSLELAVYETLRDVEGCAEAIGHHQSTEGDFTRAFSVAERYRAVTELDLKLVAGEYLRRSNRSVVIALPVAGVPANGLQDTP